MSDIELDGKPEINSMLNLTLCVQLQFFTYEV